MEFGEILGDLLGILTTQTILISIELGPKNSIMMAMHDEEFNKSIKKSLKIYLNHAVISMFILSIYMYIIYDVYGMIISIILNSLIIMWIYNQYYDLIMI